MRTAASAERLSTVVAQTVGNLVSLYLHCQPCLSVQFCNKGLLLFKFYLCS